MPAFSQHRSKNSTGMLIVGNSGAGKTSLIASLANAGYKVRVLDFDNGLDILKEFLDEGAAENVHYITIPVVADKENKSPWTVLQDVLYKGWVTEDEDLGHISTWGPDTVLVLDSLTFMSNLAKKTALALARKPLDSKLERGEWYAAQNMVENILAYIMSSSINCNVIVTAHIQTIEDGMGLLKAYPASCGTSLSTKIGRYFNNVFRLDAKALQGKVTRSLRTVSDNSMDLKSTMPSVIKAVEDNPDLADILDRLRGT